jgi:hypothetical protein
MATNLAISDTLILEAQKIGRHKTKKDAVTQALKEYISHHKQMGIFDLKGQIEYYPDYDYKKHRDR